MRQQTWQMGSATTNIDAVSDAQANRLWNPITILYSKMLNGMFAKTDEQTKIVSDEICNFLTAAGVTIDSTSSTQMASVLNQLKAEIQDVASKTFTFKGYVGNVSPSSLSVTLNVGDMWIDSSTMPTTIPVPAADIKTWDGTTWVAATEAYTPASFDTFSNIVDSEGYYWFGGDWKLISTDLSTDYFTLNSTTGKWEIKSNVNLLGTPTTGSTPTNADNSKKIVNTEWFNNKFVEVQALPASPDPDTFYYIPETTP